MNFGREILFPADLNPGTFDWNIFMREKWWQIILMDTIEAFTFLSLSPFDKDLLRMSKKKFNWNWIYERKNKD